jgi:antitoxin (DNA-binding transcriptional repressor) of toxin-antitoxin stability system
VSVTATQLRKDLFQTLDKAVQGESVEVIYKGVTITLTAKGSGSKLARAVRRPTMLVSPDAMVESNADLMADLESKWAEEARDLLKQA